MIDLTTNLLNDVKFLVVKESAISMLKGCKVTSTHKTTQLMYFAKSSSRISTLVNVIWFSQNPCCQKVINDKQNQFYLDMKTSSNTYDIKQTPTDVKNPQVNAILECVYQIIMVLLCPLELNMTDTVAVSDIDAYLTNVACIIAIPSVYHTDTVL